MELSDAANSNKVANHCYDSSVAKFSGRRASRDKTLIHQVQNTVILQREGGASGVEPVLRAKQISIYFYSRNALPSLFHLNYVILDVRIQS